MSMIVLLPVMLFAAAGIVSLAVLALSYRRAFAAFGDLRRELRNCSDVSAYSLQVRELEAPRPALRLRLVDGPVRKRFATPQPALRAAA